MNELTPFQEKLSNACAITFVIILFGIFIYFIVLDFYNDKKRNDYIKSLNEHDKSVIATYKAQTTLWPKFKKNKKKDNNTNNEKNTTEHRQLK